MENISRKKFLKTVGSVVVGGSIAGVSGFVIKENLWKNGLVPASVKDMDTTGDENFVSPYKQIASFATVGNIEAFEQYGGRLYIATANTISITDDYGKPTLHFTVKEGIIRDMAVGEDGIYLLRPYSIEVYSFAGKLVREWKACSEHADYCSFALAENFVFVTDKDNKNICKYTSEGDFVKFIESPNRFVIPSLTYGIAYAGGKLYCSNSGRHQVEIYTLDGEYTGKFGSPGGNPGAFCGCCNPVHLTYTPSGEIITSEKGNPRISCYGGDGTFRSILLNNKTLGGGTAAYEAKVAGDKIFVAGKNLLTIYAYDSQLAAAGACNDCNAKCGLKTV
ncbi:hypothetical protein FACS1894155_04100 [Bacteroidia bacterium]|nr:hypothetical protein FACS1894155_04100 [Bacteroidia bacterium]